MCTHVFHVCTDIGYSWVDPKGVNIWYHIWRVPAHLQIPCVVVYAWMSPCGPMYMYRYMCTSILHTAQEVADMGPDVGPQVGP
jgi:hypothetical protein